MTTKPVDPLTHAQLEAAMAEWPCDDCEGCEPASSRANMCGGTRLVPLLPGLRKPCINNRDDNGEWCRKHPGCSGGCQGRGWVPETDGWKVLDALLAALSPSEKMSRFDILMEIMHTYLQEGITPELAFWLALVAWVRTQQEVQYDHHAS